MSIADCILHHALRERDWVRLWQLADGDYGVPIGNLSLLLPHHRGVAHN
jgi:hypothetical protein